MHCETVEQCETITLKATPEQIEAIKALYVQNNWEYTATVGDKSTKSEKDDFDPDQYESTFVIKQDSDEEECPHCFCKPCITNDRNRQQWWIGQPRPCSRLNNKARKPCYKKFWTMLFHRRVWKDARYLQRKKAALGLDPNFNMFHWMHRRDIIPNCVLKTVRNWYPNPEGLPYLGHMWE
jgi:hypothetical protein